MNLHGLHHVTAVTGHAAGNVTFYTEALGLRLIKKTVNQDDVSAYHLFYGDEIGHPGTELTFFDWSQAIRNRPGSGAITATGLRVPDAALDWWAHRFDLADVPHEGVTERAGRRTLAFVSRQRSGPARRVRSPSNHVGGLVMHVTHTHHVALATPHFERIRAFYVDVLGFPLRGAFPGRNIIFVDAGSTTIEIIEDLSRTPGSAAAGGWIHLALEVPDTDAAYAELSARGVPFHVEPVDFPEEAPSVRIAFFKDPDGNELELVQPLGARYPEA